MEMIEQKESFEQGKLFRRFVLFSIALHVLLIIYMAIKSLVFPDTATEYLPSLRVDLVALPDQKKNDTLTPKPAEPEPEAQKPKAETKPDVKKLKATLERIKAIERIKALAGGDEVRGNKISKGSALTGEAKTSLETTYFDVILERVRSNWELPKWLQEQNLSAKVTIYLDARGQMKSFKFTKSSGNDQFDSEVKRTLQASSPFPLPPDAISSDLSGSGILLGFPL